MSDAKTFIKLYMELLNAEIKYESFHELVILSKQQFKMVDKQYESASNNFSGHVSELISKIKDLEHQNEIKQMKIDLLLKEMEIEE